MADRRNSELHSGAAAFEGIDNSTWLPASYEVVEILLIHMGYSLTDFLGEEQGKLAADVLKNRRATIKKEVQEKLTAAKKAYADLTAEHKAAQAEQLPPKIDPWLRENKFAKECVCPACNNRRAIIFGETVGRSPVRIDEGSSTIIREVRVLPNSLACPFCGLRLKGYQEVNEAGLGAIYQITEEEDPIEFFGIVPEDNVDIDQIADDYQNE